MTFTTELGTGKGTIGGNVGTSSLWVVEGSGVISFVEPVLSGAVMTTTIWTETGEAVHSRNYVNTEPSEVLKDWLGRVRRFIPQQYMGKCKQW